MVVTTVLVVLLLVVDVLVVEVLVIEVVIVVVSVVDDVFVSVVEVVLVKLVTVVVVSVVAVEVVVVGTKHAVVKSSPGFGKQQQMRRKTVGSAISDASACALVRVLVANRRQVSLEVNGTRLC